MFYFCKKPDLKIQILKENVTYYQDQDKVKLILQMRKVKEQHIYQPFESLQVKLRKKLYVQRRISVDLQIYDSSKTLKNYLIWRGTRVVRLQQLEWQRARQGYRMFVYMKYTEIHSNWAKGAHIPQNQWNRNKDLQGIEEPVKII